MRLIKNMRPGIDRLIFCFPMQGSDYHIETLLEYMSQLNCTKIPPVVPAVLIYEAESGYFDNTLQFSTCIECDDTLVICSIMDKITYLRKR